MLLGLDEPACVAAIAFRRAILITRGEKVRIAARKGDGSETLQCGTNPLLMSLLLELVGPVSKHSENLDEQMVATKTKRRRLNRNPGGCAFELVRKDGATWGRHPPWLG